MGQGLVEDVELLHTGEESFYIVDKPESCEFLHNWFWLPKEGMVGATCRVAKVCKAFEDLVELEEERVGGKIVHLGTASAALFDVFPAIKNSWLHLVVDHAGDESVLLLEDVPEDLDEGLGAALLQEDLEDPVDGHQVKGRNIIGLIEDHFLGRFHRLYGVPCEADCLGDPFGARCKLVAANSVVLCFPEPTCEDSREDLEICL